MDLLLFIFTCYSQNTRYYCDEIRLNYHAMKIDEEL